MNSLANAFDAITVTLNPAIDRIVTIPGFTKGAVNRVQGAIDVPGGKGVNVAAALADFGLRVAATGFLGRKNTVPFDELFAQKRITDAFVRLVGPTRVGIKVYDPAHSETTDINFPGLSPTDVDLDALRSRLAAFHPTWAIVAGSLPPGVKAGFYRELITDLKKRGFKVALDTSGEALIAGTEAAPTLIKPNINELTALIGRPLGTPEEIVVAAREFIAHGVELVAISMGAAGAIFVTAREAILARAPAMRIASTVGAGDAMVAGLVAAQLHGQPLQECARRATGFSVHALTRRTPNPLGSASEISALASDVTLLTL